MLFGRLVFSRYLCHILPASSHYEEKCLERLTDSDGQTKVQRSYHISEAARFVKFFGQPPWQFLIRE